jgi:hypothetical protein
MERLTDKSSNRSAEPIYFPVSVLKLSVLSICSFGLYEIYWFGENWRCEKARTNEPLRPVWRAVLAFFFCNALLNRIKSYGGRTQVSVSYSSGLLTALYILLTLCYRLPSPWCLIGTLAFLPLIPAQRAINGINAKEAPGADPNTRFSRANWVAILIGGTLYLLVALGSFFPK